MPGERRRPRPRRLPVARGRARARAGRRGPRPAPAVQSADDRPEAARWQRGDPGAAGGGGVRGPPGRATGPRGLRYIGTSLSHPRTASWPSLSPLSDSGARVLFVQETIADAAASWLPLFLRPTGCRSRRARSTALPPPPPSCSRCTERTPRARRRLWRRCATIRICRHLPSCS